MSIKIKLTKNQLITLHQMVRDMELPRKTDLTQKLIKLEMLEVFKKLHSKIVMPKDLNVISLSDAQAIAFVLFFNQIDLSDMQYENAVVNKIIYTIQPKLI